MGNSSEKAVCVATMHTGRLVNTLENRQKMVEMALEINEIQNHTTHFIDTILTF